MSAGSVLPRGLPGPSASAPELSVWLRRRRERPLSRPALGEERPGPSECRQREAGGTAGWTQPPLRPPSDRPAPAGLHAGRSGRNAWFMLKSVQIRQPRGAKLRSRGPKRLSPYGP